MSTMPQKASLDESTEHSSNTQLNMPRSSDEESSSPTSTGPLRTSSNKFLPTSLLNGKSGSSANGWLLYSSDDDTRSDEEDDSDDVEGVNPSLHSLAETHQNLREKMRNKILSGEKWFSLEFFPPRTKAGAANLLSMFERMGGAGALFIDVTWHPAGNPAGESETSSMAIASAALNYCGFETVLHMTCLGKTETQLLGYLEKAKKLGIRNILALRGDPISTDEDASLADDQYRYGYQLVELIRKHFGNYFVVIVAGYPCGHPEARNYEEDLMFLKKKVDAGADVIISQLFFKPEKFITFVEDCRKLGITIPILPGLMPIQSYDSLRHIVRLSKLEVPESITSVLEPLKGNDEAIRKFGIKHCVDMIKALFEAGVAPGLHFYTLNREVATERILKEIGLWNAGPRKCLPWKAPPNPNRCKEDVRPIFWARRPKSYVYRTQTWNEFPNGRWGSSQSPAFGDLKDYYLFYLKSRRKKDELLSMWGERLQNERDVWNVFYSFITGEPNEHGVKVSCMPWSDDDLDAETLPLQGKLAELNKKGILTINSQPPVNGAPSDDPVHGWGPEGGYVYQKAYLEFFTSRENVEILLTLLPRFPFINYHIVDRKGSINVTNCSRQRSIAVTWGVFPGSEIVQPTVVDPKSFKVWKDEAFTLWMEQWAKLYPVESESFRVIEDIANTYLLVNLVDNEYVKATNLWNLLDSLFEEKERLAAFNSRPDKAAAC